jgi:hypothetical protein
MLVELFIVTKQPFLNLFEFTLGYDKMQAVDCGEHRQGYSPKKRKKMKKQKNESQTHLNILHFH